MKTKYIGMLAVMAVFGFSACSNEEDLPQMNAEEGLPICFQVSTDEMQSRASHADGNTIEEFGLQMKSNSPEVTYPEGVITFKGKGEGNQRVWVPNTNVTWQKGSHNIDMIAFCPKNYFDDWGGPFKNRLAVVRVEEYPNKDSYQTDLMSAKITNFDPSTLSAENPSIKLTFKHLLSQLRVVLTFPEGTSPEKIGEVQTVCVNGSKRRCRINLVTNEFDGWDEVGPVYAYQSEKTATTATFNCILVPQTIAAGKIKITFFFDGESYQWTSNQDINLSQNTSHTLHLKVNHAATQTQALKSRIWGEDIEKEVVYHDVMN